MCFPSKLPTPFPPYPSNELTRPTLSNVLRAPRTQYVQGYWAWRPTKNSLQPYEPVWVPGYWRSEPTP